MSRAQHGILLPVGRLIVDAPGRSSLELEDDRTRGTGTPDLTFMFRHHVLQSRVILKTEHTETEHGESQLSSDLIFWSRPKTEQAS